jgi:DNA-binding NtrC family response regulator
MTQNKYPASPVLVVDDEEGIITAFDIALRSAGITNVLTCIDARRVPGVLAETEPSVILLDLTMPHIRGEELLVDIRTEHPQIPVIIVTGNNELDHAVHCMKSGAFDYMVKPVEKSRLVSGVNRAIEIGELTSENRRLKERFLAGGLEHPEAFSEIVTMDPHMRTLFQYAEAIARSSQPVLITGESGVGKELMARALYRLAGRPGAFVSVNVAGIDDQAFSDTLFGHAKGAYTGADGVRKGLVEQASGGTLFLDEIGELAHESQVKLLRLLQEREYYPLGSDLSRKCDAHVIVATNQALKTAITAGRFRKDLYYRLSVHHLEIPPLRERQGDIPILLDQFLEAAAREFHKKMPAYPDELPVLLKTYPFPGNIRELRSMVFDAMAEHHSKKLSMSRFKAHMDKENCDGPGNSVMGEAESAWLPEHLPLPTIEGANRLLIREALRRTDGNRSMAARILGISRQRLLRHMDALNE